ncbi:MAG: cytochrome c biogenesis protein CcsA [Candidatus Omnitrophica bacterium]|nr:cytochrome c biogenesis protein CcsA [Candidatus Omnitrophota bacterium]
MVIAHTVCALLSYVAFLVAFLSGALFLVQERQVKRKRMGWLFRRLPALGTLDRLNLLAIGAGFGLLSLGMAFGLWGSRMLLGSRWPWDPKVLLTAVLWVAYLTLWMIRIRSTLRGRKIALLSILGFSLVLFTFLGVNRWLPTWHAYL